MSDHSDQRPSARYHARFFFDGGICLWSDSDPTRDAFEYAIEIDRLPLSPSARSELEHLCDEHGTRLNLADPVAPSPWRQAQCDAFNSRVIAAFQNLRSELGPEWNIRYAWGAVSEDPELDVYLSDPDGWHERRNAESSAWAARREARREEAARLRAQRAREETGALRTIANRLRGRS